MNRKKIILVCIILLGVLVPIYLYFENNFLKVSNYIIVSHKIPKEFDGFKIIQISDYHNELSSKLNRDLVVQIKNEKPDIITITGDLIDSRKTNIEVAIDLVKKLKKIASIYYVTGNHEAQISNYDELIDKLRKQDVMILDDKGYVLERKNSKINIVGIDDPQMLHEYYVDDSTIIGAKLKNIDYDEKLYSILLSHRPEMFDFYVKNNFDLILTGHTHGGQISLPFIGGVIAPNQGLFPKYDNGLFKDKNTNMIVSSGIGNSLLPFRINNRPELVIVTLKSN